MGRDFRIECAVPLPRSVLWRIRSTKLFMGRLVEQGALARMDAYAPVKVRATSGSLTAMQRTFFYVPKEMEIPEMVKTVFSDSYLEIHDRCAWDDGVCEEDEDHRLGKGDLCLVRSRKENQEAQVEPEEEVEGKTEEEAEAVVANSARRCYSQNFSITPGVLSEIVKTTGNLMLLPSEDGDTSKCRHILAGTVNVGIPFLGGYVEDAIIYNMETFYSKYDDHLERIRDWLLSSYCGGRAVEDVSVDDMLEAADRVVAESQAMEEGPTAKDVVAGTKEAGADANTDANTDADADSPVGVTHVAAELRA